MINKSINNGPDCGRRACTPARVASIALAAAQYTSASTKKHYFSPQQLVRPRPTTPALTQCHRTAGRPPPRLYRPLKWRSLALSVSAPCRRRPSGTDLSGSSTPHMALHIAACSYTCLSGTAGSVHSFCTGPGAAKRGSTGADNCPTTTTRAQLWHALIKSMFNSMEA